MKCLHHLTVPPKTKWWVGTRDVTIHRYESVSGQIKTDATTSSWAPE